VRRRVPNVCAWPVAAGPNRNQPRATIQVCEAPRRRRRRRDVVQNMPYRTPVPTAATKTTALSLSANTLCRTTARWGRLNQDALFEQALRAHVVEEIMPMFASYRHAETGLLFCQNRASTSAIQPSEDEITRVCRATPRNEGGARQDRAKKRARRRDTRKRRAERKEAYVEEEMQEGKMR